MYPIHICIFTFAINEKISVVYLLEKETKDVTKKVESVAEMTGDSLG